MTENQSKKKVIIIGAGPAGLTAAFELLRQEPESYNVTVLEESAAIGGISRTVQYNGNRMDIGGHRFFSKDQRVMDWWKERMPIQGSPSKDDILTHTVKPLDPKGPDPEKEDIVMLFRNRVSRIYYLKKFFDYPISLKAQTFINMGLKNTLISGSSYLVSVFHKLPETSLENFYRNRFGKKLYSMFFENYTEKVWGRHPSEISADWGAQRVKGLSVTKIIIDMFSKILPAPLKKNRPVETSLIEQFWYPKFGPGQLWELTADQITQMGGIIRKNCQVTGIKLVNNQVQAVTVIENGEQKEIEGDIFLSSMPLKDLVMGMGSAVPDEIARIAKGLPYRDFITVGLILSDLKLKNQTK
ncbi:MAG TPA: NAD(P)-binding protein, partial [Flexilinea sp.]|nr:NAD(P)-binding protein [Flexilinea sp.]HQP45310.1 NAD(P)-binding protein [Flexilinea sp.]